VEKPKRKQQQEVAQKVRPLSVERSVHLSRDEHNPVFMKKASRVRRTDESSLNIPIKVCNQALDRW